LILLDEPFAAVDPKTKEEIRRNIKELADSGIGILLTDHDVREVLKITTRSYLIVEGKVVAQGSPSELIRNQIAVDAYLGTTFTDNTLGGIPQIYSGTELPKTTTVPPQNAPIQLQQPVHLDTPVALPSVQTIPITQELNPLVVSSAPVLSEDRIRQRIEELRFQETAPAAELDLLQMGRVVIPWLLAAMERHEMILRDRAFYVLQKIVDARLIFEPYAPEVDRRHQVNLIRRQLERRAG
jgi:lipopolysaccharide export system ATP-binding protein